MELADIILAWLPDKMRVKEAHPNTFKIMPKTGAL